jgi:hypothetical protein
MHRFVRRGRLLALSAGALLVASLGIGTAHAAQFTQFDMQSANGCLPRALAHVSVASTGPVEGMLVNVSGLPANTDFDLFVIQKATGPFGVSWYQGDIETDGSGNGTGSFVGRFNIETFALSPAAVTPVDAARPHKDGTFPDATAGVAFQPIHTYHLGLWFNSPADAQKAGCPGNQTPFNGDHTAGIQILNTAQIGEPGPLAKVTP